MALEPIKTVVRFRHTGRVERIEFRNGDVYELVQSLNSQSHPVVLSPHVVLAVKQQWTNLSTEAESLQNLNDWIDRGQVDPEWLIAMGLTKVIGE